MQLNTTAALITAIISAIIGFGIAFYLQNKLNKKYTKKSQKFFTLIGIISLGYGITMIANEIIGYPLQGLRIRTGHLTMIAITNVIIIPLLMYGIILILNIKSNRDKEPKIDRDIDNTLNDEFWKMAYEELNRNKDTATWAKVLAESDGDESKANARYIKIRAHHLMNTSFRNEVNSIKNTKNTYFDQTKEVKVTENNKAKSIIYIGAVTACLIGFTIWMMNYDSTNTQSANSSVSKGNNLTIEINRSENWLDSVQKLIDDINRGAISVSKMHLQTISKNSTLSIDGPKLNRILASKDVLAAIEEKNIWWVSNNELFLRLFNPHSKSISEIEFTMWDTDCTWHKEPKLKLKINISHSPMLPFQYRVYSSKLPFNFRKTLGEGTKCGVVTAAITQS